MTTEPLSRSVPRWRGFYRTVRGASHMRSGAPNQDAGEARPLEAPPGVVLAVADGHGAKAYTRSDRGSRFAVSVATALLAEWLRGIGGSTPETLTRESQQLANQVVTQWRAQVDADLEREPPRSMEGTVDEPSTPQSWRTLYGSTLIAAALTDDFGLYMQVGDGDLLVVAPDGAVATPLPNKKELAINQTESLCQNDAIDRLRIKFEAFTSDTAPTLVLLASDGYANSFTDEQAFLQVGTDMRNYIVQNGLDWVAERTEGWLAETSSAGSGDDITLALAWREITWDRPHTRPVIEARPTGTGVLRPTLSRLATQTLQTTRSDFPTQLTSTDRTLPAQPAQELDPAGLPREQGRVIERPRRASRTRIQPPSRRARYVYASILIALAIFIAVALLWSAFGPLQIRPSLFWNEPTPAPTSQTTTSTPTGAGQRTGPTP